MAAVLIDTPMANIDVERIIALILGNKDKITILTVDVMAPITGLNNAIIDSCSVNTSPTSQGFSVKLT